jgi:hypothetical protein
MAMEAQLAGWQLAEINGDRRNALRLRGNLQEAARHHNMGRILSRIQQSST